MPSPSCRYCNSENIQKRGFTSSGKQRIRCNECGGWSTISQEESVEDKQENKIAAKILLFDIETAPMEVYVWGLRHNDYIPPDNIIKDYSILTWSAKWLFESEVISEKVSGQDAINREDSSILKTMWKLLDDADVVVVQNGKKFDIPKLNARFLRIGFPPPMYYQVIDTKEVMSKNFGLSSNKLDYANKFLGIDVKDDMEFQDWIDCVHGDEAKLQKMCDYNKTDVVIMEELYLKLRPWIPSHANLGIYADTDQDCCPNCQSTELRWSGQYATPLGIYEAFRCLHCGAIGRSTKKLHKIKSVDIRN